MSEIKSKVMEGLYGNWISHWHRDESHVDYVASQIRAGVKEYDEMMEILSMTYIVDDRLGRGKDGKTKEEKRQQALAAFGVEEA